MALLDVTAQQAAAELLRRRRARISLLGFAQAVPIPGAPMSDDPDEWLFEPLGSGLASHHRLILEACQRCIETPMGRLMLFLPPGSAKSTYAAVLAPAWAMGRAPGFKTIVTSYAATPAERCSKRTRAISGSPEYSAIWPERTTIKAGSAGVTEWELTNDSGLLAAGILGAITSARADLLVIDDPVAGREEANSLTIRKKTREAYDDDLLTRLKPGASIILIQTRWHPEDLAGSILPEDYNGESGPILCRDGLVWDVICLPAKAEREDDPLGRKVGEYLWPEWFPPEHWAQYEKNPRTWAALYQQRPRPDTGNQFEAEWFEWYDETDVPANLRIYGASDYAVTKKTLDNHPDFTEHGIFGVDEGGDIWIRDWWFGQEASDVTIKAEISLARRWKPVTTFGESGVIENAIGPLRKRLMREAKVFVMREWLPSVTDKVSRAAGFRARAHARTVHLPRNKAWANRLVDQLVAFTGLPGGQDDAVDVCGLIGRALDQVRDAQKPSVERRQVVKPYTRQWLEHSEHTVDMQERKREML